MKRSRLERKTPLSRGWPQGRSARQLVKRDELDAVTPALLERARYLCEICRVAPIAHRHHRLRRSQGGTNALDNLLALCGDCHDMTHTFPALSYSRGWLVKSGKVVEVPSHRE